MHPFGKTLKLTVTTQILVRAMSVVFGAFGTYLLGNFSAIPKPLWGTFDEGTVLFLAASGTLMATVTWASFKLSKPIIQATYVFGVFLYCKFILGPKYPRGLRHPKVARFMNHTYRRFLNSDTGRARTLVAQLILTVAFLWSLFFSSAEVGDSDFLPSLLAATMLFAFATLAANGVASDISHRNFFITSQGLGLLAAFSFLFCFTAGSLRISDSMNRLPLSLHSSDRTCLIRPLFPVSGGELIFLQESRTFAIIRNEGSLVTLHQEGTLEEIAPCWE